MYFMYLNLDAMRGKICRKRGWSIWFSQTHFRCRPLKRFKWHQTNRRMLLEKGSTYDTLTMFNLAKELTVLCDLTNWMTNEVTFFPKCHTLLSIMLYCVDLSHAKEMVEKKEFVALFSIIYYMTKVAIFTWLHATTQGKLTLGVLRDATP